jgi:hypothetical protein
MMPAVRLTSAHAKSIDKGRTLETAALATTAWMERWLPDTFSFAVLTLIASFVKLTSELIGR